MSRDQWARVGRPRSPPPDVQEAKLYDDPRLQKYPTRYK
jgi:hypothetical protein